MNKYAKLIKGLRCDEGKTPEEGDGLGCANKKCKYRDVDGACDLVSMTLDAAAAITALQDENAEKDKEIERLTERLQASPYGDDKIDELEEACENLRFRSETAEQKLSRVEAERDAVKRDFDSILRSCTCEVRHEFCARCDEPGGCDSDDCHDAEWRGAQGEG